MLARFSIFAPFLFLLSYSQFLNAQDFDDDFEGLEFVTPTKSSISVHTSPNSVTKISAENLYYLGVDSLPDAMSLIPGFIVSDLHGSYVQVGYHGLASSTPRRTDILYNGSSIYRAGYAGLEWRRTPYFPEDLSSIEGLRGSAVADFGGNALTGAVNLMQKPIALEPAFAVSAKMGSGGVQRYRSSFHVGENENHVYGRAFYEKSEGYDYAKRSSKLDDDFKGEGLLFSGEHSLNQNKILDWNVAYSAYDFAVPSFDWVGNTELMGEGDAVESDQDSVQAIDRTEKSLHAVIKLSDTFESTKGLSSSWNLAAKYSLFDLSAKINFCNVQGSFDPILGQIDASPRIHIDPVDFPLILQSGLSTGVVQLDASILSPLNDDDQELLTQLGQRLRQFGPETILSVICGVADISSSEERVNFGGHYVSEFTKKLSVGVGFDVIYSKADSDTYLQGEVDRATMQVTTNVHYKPKDWINFNFGVGIEDDNYLHHALFSPRLNLNLNVGDNFVIKTLYSKSYRSLDIYETDRAWQLSVDYDGDSTNFLGQEIGKTFRVARSPEYLDPEKVESIELGFVYTPSNRSHLLEAKIFKENLSSLVSDPFLYLEFDLTNNGEIKKHGFEAALSGKFGKLSYGTAYTYLDYDTDTAYEKTLIAQHIGSVWGVISLPFESKLGLAYRGHNGSGGNRTYSRYDVTYTKEIKWGGTISSIQLGYRRYPKYTYTYTEFTADDTAAIGYDNPDRYFLSVKSSF